MISLPSPNHGPRPDGSVIDMLVLHYTGMRTAQEALERLCDPGPQVSAHYVIDEDGTIYGLVPEHRRAWHAGVASWRGQGDVNSRSIGIELVNPGHEFGLRPFPSPQIEALIPLAQAILSRHPIPARHVLGHSDIAPTRKQDPGELFPWHRLAEHQIGIWPQAAEPRWDLLTALQDWGYDISDANAAITAFQRRFRPRLINGCGDDECTRLANGLL